MKPFLHLIVWSLICFGVFTAYGFWYKIIANKSVAVVDLQSQINVKTETADRVASARATLAEIAGDEAVVQSYFVSETRIVPFIGDLEARARAQGASMKVNSVSTGGTTKQPTLILALVVDGTFDAVMRTVGAIEYAPYHLTLSRLSVAKSGKETWHADLGLTVGSVPATVATTTQQVPKKISRIDSP